MKKFLSALLAKETLIKIIFVQVIVLLFMARPFGLIVAYGVLGSLFMPFLAGTLIWLLNSERTPRAWRNGWLSNLLLGAAAVLFAVLAGNELAGML